MRETRPGESLWAIAERELGDGERWREIADLNAGRTMTDGQVFRVSSFLQPGWQLQMPETGAASVRTQLDEVTRPAVDEESKHVVTVRAGDYLSTIAQEELGDGNAWPQVFEASRGRPQPNGLPPITDPNLIRPGQQVTVPGTQPEHSPEGRHPKSVPSGQ
ncbi:LysM peptidoglycan-binding domain-containing protein [Streptomyces chartreusis]|uniref:LysM peptidoglycan-binding domain-containing protein n=1 Tax=Streptomyces chartreusis TaxID=1969 RepID=UPI002E19AC2A